MATRRALPRRTFLKATGVAMALPLLDVMTPAFARTTNLESPQRMLNICCTLGLYDDYWTPKTTGADYAATDYLSILDRHRAHYTVLSGLSHEEQTGRQPHNSEITWLTAARHPGLDGFQNTISIDQMASNHFGYVTRFPSVVLGTATPQSQSYTASGVMTPAETSPATLFRKLFLRGTDAEIAEEAQRLSDGGSILDHLAGQARSLQGTASAADRQKLDAYFESVRTAENDLTEVQAWMDRPKPAVAAEPPVDSPDKADIIGRIRLMFGLIPLIFETDSSRVISLMIHDHGVVPKVAGVNLDQHGLSHHGQDESKIVQLKKIETEIVQHLDGLLGALRERPDGDGTLLDQTSLLFGSNLGNASSHEARNLPVLVAGGGFKHGRHIAHDKKHNVPLCNLYVTLLQSLGMEVDAFGQSSGSLALT
jgi:hypothetical protein